MKLRTNLLLSFAVPCALATLFVPGAAQDPEGAVAQPASAAPGATRQDPGERRMGPQTLHPDAHEAISKVLSPFCPGQSLETCPSGNAAALRDSINAMAHGGTPADSIIELVLAAHGEEYRAFPKRTGTGLLAWTIPPAVLMAGLAVVVLALRRLKGPAPAGGRAGLTDEQRDRLDAALAELEAAEELE